MDDHHVGALFSLQIQLDARPLFDDIPDLTTDTDTVRMGMAWAGADLLKTPFHRSST